MTEAMAGPAFLGIGAQKAGTTWLYDNLCRHPAVWLPPVKELHYFDVAYPPAGLEDRGYQHRRGWARYRPLLRKPGWHQARWLWRFYHDAWSDTAYRRWFTARPGCLSGEITPAYAVLDADGVAAVQRTVPSDCRILFILRHPVDRLWSGLRMHARRRGLDLASLGDAELLALGEQPVHAWRSDYARTLHYWAPLRDRMQLFFYEDLIADPDAFLSTVLSFLGLDPDWRSPRSRRVSNPGGAVTPLPPSVREQWRQRFRPAVMAVGSWTGRLPDSWAQDWPEWQA